MNTLPTFQGVLVAVWLSNHDIPSLALDRDLFCISSPALSLFLLCFHQPLMLPSMKAKKIAKKLQFSAVRSGTNLIKEWVQDKEIWPNTWCQLYLTVFNTLCYGHISGFNTQCYCIMSVVSYVLCDFYWCLLSVCLTFEGLILNENTQNYNADCTISLRLYSVGMLMLHLKCGKDINFCHQNSQRNHINLPVTANLVFKDIAITHL